MSTLVELKNMKISSDTPHLSSRCCVSSIETPGVDTKAAFRLLQNKLRIESSLPEINICSVGEQRIRPTAWLNGIMKNIQFEVEEWRQGATSQWTIRLVFSRVVASRPGAPTRTFVYFVAFCHFFLLLVCEDGLHDQK